MTSSPEDLQSPGLWPSRKRGKRQAEEGARSALIAAASTVVLIGVVLWWVLTSDAWPAVQKQFFNSEHFWASLPEVAGGFWLDIRMFLVAEVLILVFALILAMIRSLRGPASPSCPRIAPGGSSVADRGPFRSEGRSGMTPSATGPAELWGARSR